MQLDTHLELSSSLDKRVHQACLSNCKRPFYIVIVTPYDLEYQPFTIRTTMFAQHLAQRGHQVQVFHQPYKRKDVGPRIHFDTPEGYTVQMMYPLKENWKLLRDAVKQADIVHFQKSIPRGCLAVPLAKYYDKPLHQDWDDDERAFWIQVIRDRVSEPGIPFWKRIDRRVLRGIKWTIMNGIVQWIIPKMVDTMGAASMDLRRKSLALGAPTDAVFPARVGVDCEQFHPSCRDEKLRSELGLTGPTVLFAGSLDVYPDLVFFVESLKVLREEIPEAQCLIVGGGFGRPRLVELIRTAGLSSTVIMTPGFVPFAEMPRYIASCELAALPFRDIPVNRCKSSLTLLECMACSVPVVTHDVGDMGWMLGPGGDVVRSPQPEPFGRAMAALAKDPRRRAQLGAQGRNRAVERFTWERTVDDLEAAYAHAIRKHQPRGRRQLPAANR